MGVQTLVFDTANSVIPGEGNIDLRDEKVNIVVFASAERFQPAEPSFLYPGDGSF